MRESLIATMDSKELVAAAETLEADEIADLAPDLPDEVVQDVIRALPQEERVLLRAALSYDEGTVGALMDFDQVTVREDVTLEAATRYLRALDELPPHTDQLFVIDRGGKLRGTAAGSLTCRLGRVVSDVWCPSFKLHPRTAVGAARLSSATTFVGPVVVSSRQPGGRVTVTGVMDTSGESADPSREAGYPGRGVFAGLEQLIEPLGLVAINL